MFKRLYEWFSGHPVEAGGYALAVLIGVSVLKWLVGDAIASAINRELVEIVGPILPKFGVSFGAWSLSLSLVAAILFLGIRLGKHVFEPQSAVDELENVPDVFIWQVFLFLRDGEWYDTVPRVSEEKQGELFEMSHVVEQAIEYDMLPIWAKPWHRPTGRYFKIPSEELRGYVFSPRDIANYLIGDTTERPHDLPFNKGINGEIQDTYVCVRTTKAAAARLRERMVRDPGAFSSSPEGASGEGRQSSDS